MGDSTEEVIPDDLKTPTSIHIYPAKFGNIDELSVLICTKSGNVYGKGLNSLVRYHFFPYPMKDDGSTIIKEFVKIEKLSGLGLKKISVGLGFGVGLTEDGDLYMWGNGPKVVEPKSLLLFRVHGGGDPACKYCCGRSCLGIQRKGGAELAYCHTQMQCIYYTMSDPPAAGVKVQVHVKVQTILECSQCSKRCTALSVDYIRLNYCQPCDLLQEGESPTSRPPYIMLSGILDVDCGLDFFCILSEKRELKVMKWRFTRIQNAMIILPENQIVSAFSCGCSHIAVIANSGALYSYGDVENEKIIEQGTFGFSLITMRKIALPSTVKKICCGNTATLCFLMDNTMCIFQGGGVLSVINSFYPGPTEGRKFYSDVVGSVKTVDRFFIKDNSSGVYEIQINESVVEELGNREKLVNEFLLNFEEGPTPDDAALKENCIQRAQSLEQKEQSGQQLSEQQYEQSEKCAEPIPTKMMLFLKGLCGQKLLSDVTIKLADGEFPAHVVVLCSSSNYFRKFFTNNDTPVGEELLTALDMSSYNPKAYRALLQHFYQAEVDVLDFEDLLDLYSLAVSYEESYIVNNVTDQLKTHIRVDSVLQLLSKAKSSGNEELIAECKTFMSTPAYKDWVISAILQDPSALTVTTCQKE